MIIFVWLGNELDKRIAKTHNEYGEYPYRQLPFFDATDWDSLSNVHIAMPLNHTFNREEYDLGIDFIHRTEIKPKRILDIGTGYGTSSHYLATALGTQVDGIDVNPFGLKYGEYLIGLLYKPVTRRQVLEVVLKEMYPSFLSFPDEWFEKRGKLSWDAERFVEDYMLFLTTDLNPDIINPELPFKKHVSKNVHLDVKDIADMTKREIEGYDVIFDIKSVSHGVDLDNLDKVPLEAKYEKIYKHIFSKLDYQIMIVSLIGRLRGPKSTREKFLEVADAYGLKVIYDETDQRDFNHIYVLQRR